MANRQELNRQAFDCQQAAHWSPEGVTESEEFLHPYVDQSLVVEQNSVSASCYPKSRNIQTTVPDVEPIQVGSLTQEVLDVINEPPIPIHDLKVEKTLGDTRPDCYCEESNAHGSCQPCFEWKTTPTPLEEHLGLSPRTDKLSF